MALPTHAQVVVIGGGIAGANMAYHLAEIGWRDVVVLERQQLSSGTTWHSAGNVTRLVGSLATMRSYAYAGELYERLEKETGQPTGWKQCGRVMMARIPERMAELRRMVSMGRILNIPIEEIPAKAVSEKLPLLKSDDLLGAIWGPTDGRVNPTDALMALVKGARKAGVRFHENVRVTGIAQKGGRVTGVETSEGTVACEAVVNAAGLWSRQIGKMAGVDVPLYAVEHFYLLTKPIKGVVPDMPTFRDPDGLIYGREDVGGLLVGAFDIGAKALPVETLPDPFAFSLLSEDWDQFEPYMKTAIHRIPALETAEVRMLLNGPESFSPDGNPLVGEAPGLKGFFLLCGFNSSGVTHSPSMARAIAQWIVTGAPQEDLSAVDVRRFGPFNATEAFLKARVTEMPSHHFFINEAGYSYKTGRDLRLSPIHEPLKAAGAQFGTAYGWERPAWFGGETEHATAMAKECMAARETVALFDRSSLGKILVHGRDAAAYLDSLLATELPRKAGRARPGVFLNAKGGVQGLPVVVRTEDGFLVLVGADETLHVHDWLASNIPSNMAVAVTEASNGFAAFGLVGPKTNALLKEAGAEDLESSAPLVECGYSRPRAVANAFGDDRLLVVETEYGMNVYEALLEAGKNHGLVHAGWLASEALRVAAGRPLWGVDVGTDTDGRALGIPFKKGAFMGCGAVAGKSGRGSVLRAFTLKGGTPRSQGAEPVFAKGRVMGVTSSGSFVPWLSRTAVIAELPARADGLSVAVEAKDYALEDLR
jgi:glycine/D-amino acid oxidase-like deaminating enzyme/glycine cleavage system aminomethyltransferase T